MSTLGFRRRLNKSQAEIASDVGVTASMVAQWESGKKNPSFETLKKLLEMGATTEELFGIDCKKTCPEFKYKADELAKIYSGVEQLAIPTPRPSVKREVTEEDVRRLIREAFEAEKK